MSARLRVVVSTPLTEELCARIERLEPRIDLVRDQSLLRRQQYIGDHVGDRSRPRTADEQRAFDELVDSADALYGIPDESARALRRTADANPRLRWVQTMAAGGGSQVRSAGLSAEQLKRIRFTTAAGVHVEPLAEFALLGALMGLKDVPRMLADQATATWGEPRVVRELADQSVLVVGLGQIGRRIASRFSSFGCRVIGVHRREVDAEVERIEPVDRLADAIAEADIVVLALPATDRTRGMVSAEVLAAVRPGCIVVNVGRGSTVDEDALIAALGDGRIGFAALDVFAVEPLPADSPLWRMPNVLVSPHTAARGAREDLLIAELFAENARRLLDGEPLLNEVDTVEFY